MGGVRVNEVGRCDTRRGRGGSAIEFNAGVFFDGVEVEGNSEAWGVGDGEHSFAVERPGAVDDFVEEGGAGEVFDHIGEAAGGGEVKVGGETEGGVPAVGDEADAVVFGHPGDAALLGDAADFGDVGLDDVEGPGANPRLEGLAAGEDFAAGDGDGRGLAEEDVVLQVVGRERFFEPEDAVGGEHVGGA